MKINEYFINALFEMQFFAGKYEPLSHVLVDNNKLISTDGFRLAIFDLKDGVNYGRFLIQKIKKPSNKLDLSGHINIEEKVINFSSGKSTKIEDANIFPDYTKILPDLEKSHFIKLNTKKLKALLDLIGEDCIIVFVPDFTEECKIDLKVKPFKNCFNINLETSLSLLNDEFKNNDTCAKPTFFKLNSSMLSEAVSKIKHSEYVHLFFTDYVSPVVVVGDNFYHLIMPVND